jgi:hypothetical protein
MSRSNAARPEPGREAAANLLALLWYATALVAIVRLVWIFA